jgi:hypothetical protein
MECAYFNRLIDVLLIMASVNEINSVIVTSQVIEELS